MPEELPPFTPQIRKPRIRQPGDEPLGAYTVNLARYTKAERRIGLLLYPEAQHDRPRTRGDCKDMPRPCPYAGCRHHLAIDVSESGKAIKIVHPSFEVWDMDETCSLDIADRGGATMEQVGELLNVTRQRVEQVERKLYGKLQSVERLQLPEEPKPAPQRRTPRVCQKAQVLL